MTQGRAHAYVPLLSGYQDEALDFYVGKLGFEARSADAQLEQFMRWLAASLRSLGDPERQLVVMVPGLPAHDPAETAETDSPAAISKGASDGFGGSSRTDDCRRVYETLRDQAASRSHRRSRPRALLRHRLRVA